MIIPLILATLIYIPSTLANKAHIELVNGDRLSGNIEKQTEQIIILNHPVLGRLQISVKQIKQCSLAKSPNKSDQVNPQTNSPVANNHEAKDFKKESRGVVGTRFLQDSTRHIGIGLSGSEGNSQTANFNVGADLKFEDQHRRAAYTAAYFFSRSDSQTTKNQFYIELIEDQLSTESRWFYFGQSRYDYDQFKGWNHRLSGSGGLGYEFLKSALWELRGRIGFGITRTLGGNDDRVIPESVLGLEGNWNVTKNQTLTARSTVHPDLNQRGEFRNISIVDWTIKLPEYGNFSVKLGVGNEYDSNPQNNAKRNDLDYYGLVGYDF